MQNWINVSKSILSDSDFPQEIKSDLMKITLPKSFYDFTFVIHKDLEKVYFNKSSKTNSKMRGWKIGYMTRNPDDLICISENGEVGIVISSDNTFHLLNSKITYLVNCLKAYIKIQEKFDEGTLDGENEDVRKTYANKLKNKIHNIDSIALSENNSYWNNLLFEMEYAL